MPAFGFCGPSYTAQSPIVDDERAMNCYCERSESAGATSRSRCCIRLGARSSRTLPESKVPWRFHRERPHVFRERRILWEIDASGTKTNRGSLGARRSIRPCSPRTRRSSSSSTMATCTCSRWRLTSSSRSTWRSLTARSCRSDFLTATSLPQFRTRIRSKCRSSRTRQPGRAWTSRRSRFFPTTLFP
jgi:hypothetical protein